MSTDTILKGLTSSILWESYLEKQPSDENKAIIQEVYRTAVSWLKAIPETFPNYTLHDEIHVNNVMNAMAGLLGDRIVDLSSRENEVLLLIAMLHDIGMVYTPEAKKAAISNSRQLKDYIKGTHPELVGKKYKELPKGVQQDYLRSLHAVRVQEVLEGEEWHCIAERMESIVSVGILSELCQAHGEDESFLSSESLNEDTFEEVDFRFCAVLLRLADILDFDGSRAPEILFSFTDGQTRSIEAFQKHLSSKGFKYPPKPTEKSLQYKAVCDDPNIENKLRRYLDWVDNELRIAEHTKRLFSTKWRDFPFPLNVSRERIESKGYDSSDFCLTMDQDRTLELLTGQNLYDNSTVFARELLQNAIDATLLREKLESGFQAKKAAIHLWEWIEPDGSVYFRIDDQGTGMTREMLRKYFLKVGNSYYESEEITQDLRNAGCTEDYRGISRFGIGFLSCFLCAKSVEVSTLYYDEKKCLRDNEPKRGRNGFGLRMMIPGLKGRFVLLNQAKNHHATQLPVDNKYRNIACTCFDPDGFRVEPGTSVVVSIDPGKLGPFSLKSSIRKFLCAPKMPVYYNGEKLVPTYDEVFDEIHKLEGKGELVYDISSKDKEKFDNTFPQAKGHYPKISLSLTALDRGEYAALPGLSGIALTVKPFFTCEEMMWTRWDQTYTLKSSIERNSILCQFMNVEDDRKNWQDTMSLYSEAEAQRLFAAFMMKGKCPTEKELGDVWKPFAGREQLDSVWRCFVDYRYMAREMRIAIPPEVSKLLPSILGNPGIKTGSCMYQGILYGETLSVNSILGTSLDNLVLFTENQLRPSVDLGRTKIKEIPVEIALYEEVLKRRLGAQFFCAHLCKERSIREWRKLRETPLGQWAEATIGNDGNEWIYYFTSLRENSPVLDSFQRAILQDDYDLSVCYERGQRIEAKKKRTTNDHGFDLFPPLLFCFASTEESKKYLCDGQPYLRQCITENHPFVQWLKAHAEELRCRFPRQLEEVFHAFRVMDMNGIIAVVNGVRAQIEHLCGKQAIDISDFPELTEADFWVNPEG